MTDTLKRTREYLTDPKHWTKGELFRDANGNPCFRTEASCACLVGATVLVDPLDAAGRRDAYELLDSLLDDMPLVVFNDLETTTHADVLALLDKAIGS